MVYYQEHFLLKYSRHGVIIMDMRLEYFMETFFYIFLLCSEYYANSHFLRPAGPHFPASQGHIKRPVLEIGRAERGLRPANQYRALSQKAMLSQSVR